MKIQTLTIKLWRSSLTLLCALTLFSVYSFAQSDGCDNLTAGGTILGEESGSLPSFDPSLITSTSLPTGGSGDIQYLWISTTDNPTTAVSEWEPISGSNSPEWDPEPITQTTYYRRCARRAGCIDYVVESNYVTKALIACDNVNDGGLIGMNQTGTAPFDPDIINNVVFPSGGSGDLEYLWFSSTVGPPFIQGSPNWSPVPNSNSADYDPGVLSDTTWYIRCARRAGCMDFIGETNIVMITVNPEEGSDCDNVENGGTIGFDQNDCAAFDPDGLVNIVTPTGGTGELEYLWLFSTTTSIYIQGSPEWIEISGSNSPDYDPGLLSQTTWFIRCVRRAGCEDYFGESNIIEITIHPEILIDNILLQNISCTGEADGAVTLTVTGGAEPYIFVWNEGEFTGQNLSALSAGTYDLEVTDQNGCQTGISVDIIEPAPLSLSFESMMPSCTDTEDGTINVILTGGTPPYTYVWSNGQAGNPLINVGAGTYTLTYSDAAGCTGTEDVTLNATDSDLSLNLTSENAICAGSNTGSATVNVLPAGEYSYQWSDADASTAATLSGVPAGTYFVTVTPASGCEAVGEVTIENDTVLSLSLTGNATSCGVSNDGQVIVEVQGGVAPYAIMWNDPNGSTTTIVNNLGLGIYSVTVTDGNACEATGQVTVEEGNGLNLEVTQQNITCGGANDGFIIVNPLSGTPPYSYNWSNLNSNNNTVSGLSPGNYLLTVTDSEGCTSEEVFELFEPAAISVELSGEDVLCGDDLGQISSILTGGTAPYSYTWSTGDTGSELNGVLPGTYALTVTDFNNCTASAELTLTAQSDLGSSISATGVTCAGANDGTASVTSLAGTPPYIYVWNTGATSPEITNLSPGTYQATVTDGSGCSVVSESVEVVSPAPISISVQITQGITDLGAEDGILDAILTGGTPAFSFQWSNGETLQSIDDLAAGFYSVTVTDANGCTDEADINLPEGTNQSFMVGDFVWLDENNDGVQQVNENGVGGIIVNLIDAETNLVIATQMTNPNGFYLFSDLPEGMYYIEFDLGSLPPETILTQQDAGNNDELDSDADPETGFTPVFTVNENLPDILTYDAGVRPKCDNVEYGGLITEYQSVCAGEMPELIANEDFPAGGSGDLEYLWLTSSIAQYTGPGDPNWSEIPNSNAPTFQPPLLSQTTYYIRCSRRECCTDYPGETNIATVEVFFFPYANISDAPAAACTGENTAFEASIVGGGTSYFWDFGTDAVPDTATTRVVDEVMWTSPGEKIITLTVTRNGCSLSTSMNLDVSTCFGTGGGINNLSVTLVEDEASLSWQTETNDTGSIFFLEKAGPDDDFVTFATLAGQAGNGQNHYQIIDENLYLGINRYRVRQLTGSGVQANSDMVWMNYLPANSPEIRVFPNPFQDRFTVNVLLPQEEEMFLQLMSPQGHILKSEIINAETYRKSFDLSAYPTGIYVIKLYYGYGDVITEKIMKK